eukprot:CAMPEP_0113650008 /NCGR_PEP_ID=MMETSP0017_2-20120614/26597_1 /TAXON_ID=2856 /ORGANISM="Cylindrotheca closterium" /LENGTH=244 /DNA_ID=CAMNT_0000562467 /DNA_START=39 /DNA_END=773 /DNA_ORIENTATION=+ /assembly_acc=CAM_ASM_000147
MSQYMSQGTASHEIVNQMIRKEKKYKEGIQQNHDLACTMASNVSKGGRLEALLGDKVHGYRDALRQLSETNVNHEREVGAFVATLRKTLEQPDIKEYSAFIKENTEKELAQINQSSIQVNQERMYLDMCTKLGDVSAQNQDDELEVVGGNTTVSLKCPITGTLLQDPMRNKVCHHVYSKHAILNYVRNRNNKCPNVGCVNTNLSMGQLEDDHQTARLVKREMIRMEEEKRQQTQNAMELEDDED